MLKLLMLKPTDIQGDGICMSLLEPPHLRMEVLITSLLTARNIQATAQVFQKHLVLNKTIIL